MASRLAFTLGAAVLGVFLARKKTRYVESVPANDFSGLSVEEKNKALELEKAFHNKGDIETLQKLVRTQAPVKVRLDYGLPIDEESDFVAAFHLLMEGDVSEDKLLENAKIILGDNEHALGLSAYVKTAADFFAALHSSDANKTMIPVHSQFIEHLKNNAVHIRANPNHENGALIIAAGLRDSSLVKEIMDKEEKCEMKNNGAHVNFKGFFGDNAAVWSAILLDVPTLQLLLDHDSEFTNIGVTASSLLHWVVVASRLDDSKERKSNAEAAAKILLAKGCTLSDKNKLGKTPLNYAVGAFKAFLLAEQDNLRLQTSIAARSGIELLGEKRDTQDAEMALDLNLRRPFLP